MVAGGLDPDNVGEAVSTARPWAVDTARGVESAPGIKDPALIERFIAQREGCGMSSTFPDARGRFGEFGGRFVPRDGDGRARRALGGVGNGVRATPPSTPSSTRLARDYVGRPSPLYLARAADGATPADARCTSSARISTTPAPTRSTTRVGQALLAGAAGKAPDRRRDQRRRAPRRQRHGVRTVRAGLPRLHGRGGRAPGSTRDVVPMRMLGRRGGPGHSRWARSRMR